MTDPAAIAPWKPRPKPLRHWLGMHSTCPPQTCPTSARLCNEADSDSRWESFAAHVEGYE